MGIDTLKIVLVAALLCGGQAAVASPEADARFIVERSMDAKLSKTVDEMLRNAFVGVYFRPLAKFGVDIQDREQFSGLIPEADLAPYKDRFLSQNVRSALAIFSPDELASLAAVLRADETATIGDVFEDNYRLKLDAALDQARSRATPSGSDDPKVEALEEMLVNLDALNTVLSDERMGETLGKELASGVASIFILVSFGHEIGRLERDLDNPVILAALRTDGVLKFANPVQRQTLLRQLSTPDDARDGAGTARFVKPPT